jgi:hypothetical protein
MSALTSATSRPPVTPGRTLLVQLQHALRELIYQQGRIHPGEVDVRFELPVREWVESLTRPTVSIYMFDMRENLELRINGAVTPVVREGGQAMARTPLRRFELLFMLTVLTNNVEDEYALVWRVLNTLMRVATLPAAVCGPELRAADPPPALKIGRMIEGPHPMAIWSALEMPPRPSLLLAVTLPIERDELFEVPLVLGRELRTVRPTPEREAAGLGLAPAANTLAGTTTRIGGVLRDHSGAPLPGATIQVAGRPIDVITDAEGRFAIGAVVPGTLTLTILAADGSSHTVPLIIPSDSYDITLGGPERFAAPQT